MQSSVNRYNVMNNTQGGGGGGGGGGPRPCASSSGRLWSRIIYAFLCKVIIYKYIFC